MTRSRYWTAIAVSAAIAAAAALLCPLAGSTNLDIAAALRGVEPAHSLLWQFRVPRVLVAMLAGGALALAGALFQAMLRDALATPYTLGVSNGAALGAVAVIAFGFRGAADFPAIWLGAFAGAAVVLLLVLAIASEGARTSSFTLLLAGVAINSICGAVILFIQSIAGFTQSFSISRWLMGGVDAVEYPVLGWLAAIVITASLAVIGRARDWNLMAVGDEWARARGAAPRRLLIGGFIAGSVLTGAITALTGPIGFVGLIVPHAIRLKLDADHRVLLPCSFLLGAAFLAVCDAAARALLAPSEVPVGVITALLGGPFFILLLRTKRKALWL